MSPFISNGSVASPLVSGKQKFNPSADALKQQNLRQGPFEQTWMHNAATGVNPTAIMGMTSNTNGSN